LPSKDPKALTLRATAIERLGNRDEADRLPKRAAELRPGG
jgi:Flp pilus assembly protein TadD